MCIYMYNITIYIYMICIYIYTICFYDTQRSKRSPWCSPPSGSSKTPVLFAWLPLLSY